MKPFSTFIKAAALLFVAAFVHVPKAAACGWDATDNYYLFYAFSGDRTNTELTRAKLTEWWTRYAGTVITAADLDALAEEENVALLQRSNNPIVRAAYRKGDTSMQRYLALLCEYLKCAPAEFDPWSYPDAEELAAQRATFAEIARRAGQAQPGKLAPQFALLRIRALFQATRWQEVVKVWKQSVKPLPESVFKDMATGFYAGALRKLGSDEDAAEIYATLGDLHSATWCVHNGRNIGTIRRLYKQNPNSQAVRLLVQDFVNNVQETLDNIDCEGCRLGHNGYISKVYANEVAQFVTLAEDAAKNTAVEDACMWLSAAAWVQYLHGYKANAKTLIDRAMAARGATQMKDCARIIRIVINSGQDWNLDDFEAFALPELQWLANSVSYKEGSGYNSFFNAAQRIYLRHLVPLYQAQNRETDALLCIAEAERCYNLSGNYDRVPYQVGYSGNYVANLLNKESDVLQQIYSDLFQSPMSPMRRWLVEQLSPEMKQADLYTDLIGTRLMKEGEFAKAEPWLKQTSLEFLSAQNISYYMARRDYNQERWIGLRQTLPEVRDGFGGEEPTTLSCNQKLSYCRDVLALQRQLEKAKTAVQKAGAHYALASLLFQGSLQGDCWYLTEYYRSSDPAAVYLDTLAYKHLEAAVPLAREAGNIDLQTRAMMGKAFMNLDAGRGYETDWYQFYTYRYNWKTERYKLEFEPDDTKQQSRDFVALAAHVRTLPANYKPLFLTKCDVLMTWLKRNK